MVMFAFFSRGSLTRTNGVEPNRKNASASMPDRSGGFRTARRIIRNLEAKLRKGQDTAALRSILGEQYLRVGQPIIAVNHIARATEQNPHNPGIWLIYAKALLELEQISDARNAFKTALGITRCDADEFEKQTTQAILEELLHEQN